MTLGITMLLVIMFLPGGLWSVFHARTARTPDVAVVLEARQLNKSFGAVTAADDINVAHRARQRGRSDRQQRRRQDHLHQHGDRLSEARRRVRSCTRSRDITGLQPRQITELGICRSFQIPQLFNTLSVYENLLVGVGIAARSQRADASHTALDRDRQQAEQLIERFSLEQLSQHKRPACCRKGVRKLLDIAMAVAGKPARAAARRADQRRFRGREIPLDGHGDGSARRPQGVTVLFVEHDMDIVSRYTHRVLAFYEGRIIADGEPQTVLEDAEVRRYVIGEQLHVNARKEAARAAH